MPEPTAPDCLSIVIEREERQAALRAALLAMSPLEQQVLLRRVCGDQPLAAIALALHVPADEARSAFDAACLRLGGGSPGATCDGRRISEQTPNDAVPVTPAARTPQATGPPPPPAANCHHADCPCAGTQDRRAPGPAPAAANAPRRPSGGRHGGGGT